MLRAFRRSNTARQVATSTRSGGWKPGTLKLRWSVGSKIAAGFGLGVLALLFVGAIAFQSTHTLISVMNARDLSRVRQNDVQQLLAQLNKAEIGQQGFLLTGAESYINSYTVATEALPDIRKRLKDEGSGVVGWDDYVTKLEPLLDEKMTMMRQMVEVRRAMGAESAVTLAINNRADDPINDIWIVLSYMARDEDKNSNDLAAQAAQSANTTTLTIGISTLIASLLLIVAAVLITRGIALALREITKAAERIAAGDLSIALTADSRTDEVGVLKRAFAQMHSSLRQTAAVAEQIAEGNLQVRVTPQSEQDVLGNAFAQMVEKLRLIMRDVGEASASLAASTSEILATTNQIAAGAAETASAVAETSATVEQVKQTAHLSSEKARDVSEGAMRSTEVSYVGTNAVEEATNGMANIREQMNLISDSIVRLSEQRRAIGGIISTVNDLAEQSNLLALNAAIEAAKAGEHGRGFAVVAQEVRRLAEQSKAATGQVRAILGDIEKATNAAVLATERGSKAVEVGTKQSISAGDTIRELADNISESTRAATQIAASSQQQLIGMDQIAQAMNSINQASLQNVASTREASLSARNLNELGQKLKLVVAQYRV